MAEAQAPGRIVVVEPRGEVVMVLAPAEGGGWRCDDGWVHPARTLRPASEAEASRYRQHAARRDALVREFAAWEAQRGGHDG
jgi:hypothetical protein